MDIAEIRKKARASKDGLREPVPAKSVETKQERVELPPPIPEKDEFLAGPSISEMMAGLEDLPPLPEVEEANSTGLIEAEAVSAPAPREEAPADELAAPLAVSEVPVEDSEAEFITFMLGKEEYAIDIHQIKEVIKMRPTTDVPRAPKDIVGVISLRGIIIPIMDLRGRLGMDKTEESERIIIVKDGAGLLGVCVDRVNQVVRIPRESIESTPSINTIDGEFISGIGRHKGGMFICLDIDNILEKV